MVPTTVHASRPDTSLHGLLHPVLKTHSATNITLLATHISFTAVLSGNNRLMPDHMFNTAF